MTVYVDNAFIQATVPNGRYRHTSRWCHLMADSLEELVAFAEGIGMKRAWLQNKRSGVHFDLTEPKRKVAVKKGAVEIATGSPEWRRVVTVARSQYLSEVSS